MLSACCTFMLQLEYEPSFLIQRRLVNEFAHFCATDFMQESAVEIEQFAANCEAVQPVRDLTAC